MWLLLLLFHEYFNNVVVGFLNLLLVFKIFDLDGLVGWSVCLVFNGIYEKTKKKRFRFRYDRGVVVVGFVFVQHKFLLVFFCCCCFLIF